MPLTLLPWSISWAWRASVSLGLRKRSAIARAIDASKTRLCEGTPISQALAFARKTLTSSLKAASNSERKQYVLLITDGVDTTSFCSGKDSTGDPLALVEVHRLAKQKVRTFVVGFAGDTTHAAAMNDLACAGDTALGGATNCKIGTSGKVAKTTNSRLYYAAKDRAGLVKALNAALEKIWGDCAPTTRAN